MPKYSQDPAIRRLFTKGQPLVFSKGECIIGHESEPNGVYYINTGYVKVYSISNAGDEYIHVMYGSGELFPLIWAYLGHYPDALFYEAMSDCVVWRISKDWFTHFVTTRPQIAYVLSLQLAQQFRVFTDRVDNLECRKASERVAYRILLLASRFGTRDGKSIRIDPPLTHEVFANSINLARESVSRELEKLERKGIIRQASHTIRINDINKLANRTGQPTSPESPRDLNP